MTKEHFLRNRLHCGILEAGCDEAGRGPIAGPLYAAAVILPEDFKDPRLNDSKQMSRKNRDILREIIEREAISWAVEEISPEEIDAVNILNASITGMQRAVLRLTPAPEFLLIDGNRFKAFGDYGKDKFKTIVKGDATFASIAAASVLAKTHRDEKMTQLSAEYPMYGWDKNMGYPTADHINAVKAYGPSPYHRQSFHVKQLEATLFDGI